MKTGVLAALGAYISWGLLPIYWKLLVDVTAFETLSHRVVWSLLFLVCVMAWKRHWRWLKLAATNLRTILTFLATAVLIALNWLIYIWAVNAGYIVETSLGYFINPLVNVFLGFSFLGERLRFWQWVSVAIAFFGVAYLTYNYGTLPWIALGLAFSFGFYGLLRKTATPNALEGLSLEMGFLILPALGYLIYVERTEVAVFGNAGVATNGLLVATGVATAIPLLWFAYGARRVPLSTLGILQYMAPSLQFLLGVFVYQEEFTRVRLVGFVIIWISLLVYSADSFVHLARRGQKQRAPVVGL